MPCFAKHGMSLPPLYHPLLSFLSKSYFPLPFSYKIQEKRGRKQGENTEEAWGKYRRIQGFL
jgi:hypothetical protein